MNYRSRIQTVRVALGCLVVGAVMALQPAESQAVKGSIPEDAPPPVLTYHGLIPGLHTMKDVKEALGEPEEGHRWYNYKLYYPAEDRPGYWDIVHMHGSSPNSGLANIEAASIPEGYETEKKIRGHLGDPEYAMRMATWSVLDYGEQGVRFTVDEDGKTTGVAYVPHLYRRVPEGERDLVDLSDWREGPQPEPEFPPTPSGLECGTSEVVITPQGEDWLAEPYEVHDELKSRIAIFREGDLTVAFVGNDLFGMNWPQVNVIRKGAQELGVDYTIFAMSHNHAAGDTIGVYGHYPAEYVAHIQQQTIAGIEEALDALEPVKEIRTASQELPMDGARVQHLFRNARNPGILDPTISIIQAFGNDGEAITTMVNFACHVESLAKGAKEISADFPGYMCDKIEAEGGGQAVFLNGAVGGMVSGDNRDRTHESSRTMGLKLADIVMEMTEWAQPPAEFEFEAEKRQLFIPMQNPDFTPLYESGLRELHRGRVRTDMIYVKLGQAQFMTLPGELLPEVSYEILEHMEGFPRVLVGLGNDQIGYMIPPYDFRDDYYEETMSQGAATAVQVRDMAIRLIENNEGDDD